MRHMNIHTVYVCSRYVPLLVGVVVVQATKVLHACNTQKTKLVSFGSSRDTRCTLYNTVVEAADIMHMHVTDDDATAPLHRL